MRHSDSRTVLLILFLLNTITLAFNTNSNLNATNWSSISPLLTDPTLASQLPPIPSIFQAVTYYGADFDISNGVPFTKYLINDLPDNSLLCDESDSEIATANQFSSIRGGPYEVRVTHCMLFMSYTTLQ